MENGIATLSPHKAGGPYEITLKGKINTVVLKKYIIWGCMDMRRAV